MKKKKPTNYDIAVIGGGPAGMMAAGRAGELGASVVLIEKNLQLGLKLLMTGNGRCNLTNKITDQKILIEKYGQGGKFLYSSLNKFGVADVIDLFESRGLKTKIEKGECVFAETDKASDVLNVLIDYLKQSNVEVRTKSEVKDIIFENNKITKIILKNKQEIIAKNYIICTGGKSYPKTGSTGDGYNWLNNIGHTINDLRPSLTPVILREKFLKDLEGVSLTNVGIQLFKNNKKIDSCTGDLMFTANGLSGPAILDFSKQIGQALPGNLVLKIDLLPELDLVELDKKLQNKFTHDNKTLKNSLVEFLPKRMIAVVIKISQINPAKKVNMITKQERSNLVGLIKEFSLEIKDLAGYEKAMITGGGVSLSEINPQTMNSKIINNLYFAGEILDLDGPCGGFNLQVCWSTGYLAGQSAVK
jgi:predicted Rossmann fold flavoprotein